MTGPGYTVSYSQWTNPYTGGTGQTYYTASSADQPPYRRLVPPSPAKVFRYPGVSYSYGYGESEEDEQSGMT